MFTELVEPLYSEKIEHFEAEKSHLLPPTQWRSQGGFLGVWPPPIEEVEN